MNSVLCWMVLMAGFDASGSDDGSKPEMPPVIFVHPEPDEPMTNPRPGETPEQTQSLIKIMELKGSVSREDREKRVYQVNFNGARLTASDLQCLRAFPDLRILVIYESSITDEDLSIVKALPKLQSLNLRLASELGDRALKHLENHGGIKHLTLSGTSVTDAGMESIATLRQLESLELADTRITNRGLKSLLQLKNLDWINLNGTDIDDAGVSFLSKLATLRVVWLARTRISDAAMEQLIKLTKLENILLDDTSISDRGIETISSAQTLKTVGLRNTRITNTAITLLLELRNLKRLDIKGTRVDDGCLHDLEKLDGIYKSISYHQTGISAGGRERLRAKRNAELQRLITSGKPFLNDEEQ